MNQKQKQIMKAYLRRRQSDAVAEKESSGFPYQIVGLALLIIAIFLAIKEYLWARIVDFVAGDNKVAREVVWSARY